MKFNFAGRNRAIFLGITSTAVICAALYAGRETLINQLIKPSLEQRGDSFQRLAPQIIANCLEAKYSTYHVLAGDEDFHPRMTGNAGKPNVPHQLNIDAGKNYSQGLAVAIAKDGYLLTAAHVVIRENADYQSIYIIGLMDGRYDIAPARIVRRQKSGADSAILTVERILDRPLSLSKASTEKIAFSVANGWGSYGTGPSLVLLAGQIRAVSALSEDPSSALLTTDIPMWRGDSGGPTFSAEGRLLGINTMVKWKFPLHSDSYVLSPDPALIETLIEEDRARQHNLNPLESRQ